MSDSGHLILRGIPTTVIDHLQVWDDPPLSSLSVTSNPAGTSHWWVNVLTAIGGFSLCVCWGGNVGIDKGQGSEQQCVYTYNILMHN